MTINITVKTKPDINNVGKWQNEDELSEIYRNEISELMRFENTRIIRVDIEKSAIRRLKVKGKLQIVEIQQYLIRHDSEPRETPPTFTRTLFVLQDINKRTLFASQDKKFIQAKANYFDEFPSELKNIRRIF